jgi:hypothetical protein
MSGAAASLGAKNVTITYCTSTAQAMLQEHDRAWAAAAGVAAECAADASCGRIAERARCKRRLTLRRRQPKTPRATCWHVTALALSRIERASKRRQARTFAGGRVGVRPIWKETWWLARETRAQRRKLLRSKAAMPGGAGSCPFFCQRFVFVPASNPTYHSSIAR